MDISGILYRKNYYKRLVIIKEFSFKKVNEMDKLINLFSELISQHLINQIKAGVDLIQIFDTHSYQMDYNTHQKYSMMQLKKIS